MASSRRRVLILAYHFPPEPASGAQRIGYLAKYLSEFGWQPTVITRPTPSGAGSDPNVIRVGAPFRSEAAPGQGGATRQSPALAFLKARARDVLFIPDRAAAWIPRAVAAGLSAHRREPFDAIVSSAMPASVHLAGACLASILARPWLADYRDLWTGNPYAEEPRWRKTLLARMETLALNKASRVTTITPSLSAALESLHHKPVRAIPNAVDDEEWQGIPYTEPDCFRIVHAGSLYDGLRNPRRLLAQIGALRTAGEFRAGDVKLDFYGPNPGNLLELADAAGIGDAVRYHGVIPRANVMRAERAAALLVVIQSDDPRTAAEYGSKIFEYQAAGTQILALGPKNSILRAYVSDRGLGWFASTDDEIREALRAAFQAYTEGRWMRANRTRETARDLAQAFSDELGEMVDLPGQVPERLKESAILL